MVVKEINGLWSVHFSFSRQGVDYAMNQYLNKDISTIDQESFKLKLIDYVRSHFRMKVDHEIISLGLGGIKLGSHQTDVRFIFNEFPDDFHSIDFSVPLFKENANHHSILRFTDGENEIRKVLSKSNNYSYSFTRKEYSSEGSERREINLIWVIGSLIVGVITGLVLLNRHYRVNRV